MKKLIVLYLVIICLFTPILFANAEESLHKCQSNDDCKVKNFICDKETNHCILPIGNFLQTDDPNIVIGRVVKYLLGLSGTVALVAFMFGGVHWITSAGSPEKIKKGQNYMLWSAAGLIFTLTAYIFVNFVLKLLSQ
ncbi:hypothetical protein HN958_03170 [Candidatus Falkowbacteria bacterium]|jgi:hypothetical protein|nr:hypothetical protein [Candidatus Falkowbacteria bacterium]